MQCKKRNGNNLKNEIATEILVNYFFLENKYFPPRNTEIGDLTETWNNRTFLTIYQPPKAKSNRPALGGEGGSTNFITSMVATCFGVNVKISTLLKVEINIIKNIYFISHNWLYETF